MTAYSHVIEAPGSAGDVLTVDHFEGVRFEAPSTCLVWHPTEPTDYHEVTVVSIEDDAFTLGSADDGTIEAGMRIASLRPIDTFTFGETVNLVSVPYPVASVRSPQGDEFSGSTPFSFIPEHEGLYTYRFEDEGGSAFSTDSIFFVEYTDA